MKIVRSEAQLCKLNATFDIEQLDLSLYKDIIEDKLVTIMNLLEEINDNIEDEEEFQNELSQSLQF